MQAEVSRRLAEAGGGRTFWSATDIADAVNLGYAEISDASEWYEQYLEIELLANRPWYDLRTVVGSSFLAIRPAFDVQTNRWLIPTAVSQFDAHDRRWERVTGEPQRVATQSLWWVSYWPRVQQDSGLIKQYYTALPPPLVRDDDEPGFPVMFHDACVDFALSDLWAQDGETAFALAAWQTYLTGEAGLTQWVAGRGGDPLRQTMGATR